MKKIFKGKGYICAHVCIHFFQKYAHIYPHRDVSSSHSYMLKSNMKIENDRNKRMNI